MADAIVAIVVDIRNRTTATNSQEKGLLFGSASDRSDLSGVQVDYAGGHGMSYSVPHDPQHRLGASDQRVSFPCPRMAGGFSQSLTLTYFRNQHTSSLAVGTETIIRDTTLSFPPAQASGRTAPTWSFRYLANEIRICVFDVFHHCRIQQAEDNIFRMAYGDSNCSMSRQIATPVKLCPEDIYGARPVGIELRCLLARLNSTQGSTTTALPAYPSTDSASVSRAPMASSPPMLPMPTTAMSAPASSIRLMVSLSLTP